MNQCRTNASAHRSSRSHCPGASGLPLSLLRAATLGTLLILALASTFSTSSALAAKVGHRAAPRTHRVAWGETTHRIAARYGVPVGRLMRANGLRRPSELKAGTTLVIPGARAAAPRRPAAPATRAAAKPAPAAKRPDNPPAAATAVSARPRPTASRPAPPAPAPSSARRLPPPAQRPVTVAEATPRPSAVETAVDHPTPKPAPVVLAAAVRPRVDTARRIGEPILMTPSRSRLLAVQKATRVQVDDAAGGVVEVQPLSTRELLILARAPGVTTLRVWDERGIIEHEVQVVAPSADMGGQVTQAIGLRQVTARMAADSVLLEGRVASAAEANRAERIAAAFAPKVVNLIQVPEAPTPAPPTTPAIAEQVRAALRDPAIEVEGVPGRSDAVVLRGTASRTEDVERAARTAGAFAQTVVNLVEVARPDQVRVQVRMVDVDRKVLRELGIRWPDEATWGQKEPGGEFRMLTSITATIRALQDENRANTLATPSLLVASGEKGEIVIGGRLPIPALITGYAGSTGGVAAPTGTTGTVGSGLLGQSVEFVDFGVKLQIAPKVLAGDEIALKLGTEVSAIDRTTAVNINGSVVPGFSTKRTDTTFRVRDGQTLVIGGLISKEDARAVHKFPILADVPVLGKFFQSVRKDSSERELIMFVTPQLVASTEGAAETTAQPK